VGLTVLQSIAPDPADLSQCVHCGLCLPNCPTYLVSGYEAESPRGRIHLMQSLNEGRIEPTAAYRQHLELCLVCRNCESVCPSGVPFGRIMEAGRAQLYARTSLAWHERALRRLAFRELLPHQARLRVLFGLLLVYQRSGVRRLTQRMLPKRLADMEALLPKLPRPFTPRWEVYPAVGEVRYRVGLFTGCVMPLVYGPVHEATVRVLRHNGCEVHIPRQQSCCGALNVHGGEREISADLARRNIRAFLGRGLDAVVVNSAGCGSTMKEYHDLLGDAREVEQFVSLTKDLSEFLASIELAPMPRRLRSGSAVARNAAARNPAATSLEGSGIGETSAGDSRKADDRMRRQVVTLQESCHLVHAQRIREAPRKLLAMLPDIELRDMARPELCCGSAGLYMLTQPEMSSRLLNDKMRDVASTGATTVVTANPGCMMQLQRGLHETGLKGEVKHIVELLDEAYGGAPASRSTGSR
jgi:glycolate oxidase iron-sulfur subunit